MSRRGALVWPGVIAAVTAVLVWNVVFDLWLGQGERQYLWERARYRLGEGPAVSLDGSMASSIRGGVWVATAWAAVVVAAILGASYVAYRRGRREHTTNDQ
jgi:TRAP-type C4-dicarboxylate transport system permease large subunit